ncbi:hypothetical protein FRB99_002273 [Tulasnella sp. 403]|nr:hypothetical protein FRB99_002273 [Tulasnella sp. 403]
MHSVLKTPEILLLIFDELDGPRLLVNPCLVCSTWAPFALSVTWKKNPIRLSKWIARLQPPIWVNNKDSHIVQPLAEYPLPISWADLLRFSLKVHNLIMDAKISYDEEEGIKKLLQGRPFFPNLRKVRMKSYTRHESVFPLVLGGSTCIEAFILGSLRESVDLQKWVGMLHPNAVRQFHFYLPLPSTPFDVTRFHCLQRLVLDDDSFKTALDYEWWPTFSRLQDLRTLVWKTHTIIPPTTVPSTITFPFLRSLSLEIPGKGTLVMLLHSAIPSLLELKIRQPMLEGPEFCELMAHLTRHSPLLENLEVNIEVEAAFLMGNSIPTTLAGFQLKGLELNGLIYTTTIPDDGATFVLQDKWAKMLETLESFALSVSYMDDTEDEETSIDYSSVATEDTLVAILKVANRLKKLVIEVTDFETHRFIGKLEKEFGRVPILGLTHLMMGIDYTSSDLNDIEKDLRSIFPGLRSTEIYPRS